MPTRENSGRYGRQERKNPHLQFPQGRVTDHRINFTLYSLDSFINGDIGQMIEALRLADQTARLEKGE